MTKLTKTDEVDQHKLLLNQVWPLATRAWFLEIALVRASVCVCVCESAPEGINNQWRDVGHVQLFKQVYGFPLLLITLYDTCCR